jgi:hypothetical protein
MSRNRLAPILLAVAMFLTVGCKPAPQKMGVALPTAPPIFQVIPAGANPNTLGLPGAQGTVLQNSGGVGSWVMGPGGVWVTNPPATGAPDGGYSVSVADGGGLSGNGASATPLSASGIPLSKLATQGDSTVVGVPVGGGTEAPIALTTTQLTALINPATPLLPGAMTAALATSLQTLGSSAIILGSYPCGNIDLTATHTFIQCAPAIAGKTFITHRVFVQNVSVAGSLSVAATVEMGQTGSLANIIAAATTLTNAAQFNLGTGAVIQSNALQAAQIASVASGVTVTIAASGTGGFVFTVNIILEGFYL